MSGNFMFMLLPLVINAVPIYYLSDTEGTLSHYFQLEQMWANAKKFGRTVVAAPFKSAHNTDVDSVSLCDIFDLPPEISCMTKEYADEIISSQKCLLFATKKMTWLGDPRSYSLPENVTRVHYVDYRNVYCIAGLVIPMSSEIFPNVEFNKNYSTILPAIKVVMGLDETYGVAHWRRGDQLRTRCPGKKDVSVNCGTVETFLSEMRAYAAKYSIGNHGNFVIATDDDMEVEKTALRAAGYKLVEDFKEQILALFHSTKNGLSTVDMFTIDLMLMCDCKWFFGWGVTSTNGFLPRCRKEAHKLTRIPESLSGFLHELGLEKLLPVFEKNDIELAMIPFLEVHDFQAMGVSIGDRIQLRQKYKDLEMAGRAPVLNIYLDVKKHRYLRHEGIG